MARPSLRLVRALRTTANRIGEGGPYQWGHMGMCNCGHLAQTLTHLSKAEIHRYAMERSGDWAAQLLEFCPTSGYPMDIVIDTMLQAGLTREDLTHLERLDDPDILRRLPQGARHLKRNSREDAERYLRAWADHLEAALKPTLLQGAEAAPSEGRAQAEATLEATAAA